MVARAHVHNPCERPDQMTDLVQFQSPRPTGVHSRPPGARSLHASPAPAAQHLAQDHSGRTKLTGDSTAVRARQNIRSCRDKRLDRSSRWRVRGRSRSVRTSASMKECLGYRRYVPGRVPGVGHTLASTSRPWIYSSKNHEQAFDRSVLFLGKRIWCEMHQLITNIDDLC